MVDVIIGDTELYPVPVKSDANNNINKLRSLCAAIPCFLSTLISYFFHPWLNVFVLRCSKYYELPPIYNNYCNF